MQLITGSRTKSRVKSKLERQTTIGPKLWSVLAEQGVEELIAGIGVRITFESSASARIDVPLYEKVRRRSKKVEGFWLLCVGLWPRATLVQSGNRHHPRPN